MCPVMVVRRREAQHPLGKMAGSVCVLCQGSGSKWKGDMTSPVIGPYHFPNGKSYLQPHCSPPTSKMARTVGHRPRRKPEGK